MKIEISIPCYNEEKTVAKVVQDFRSTVPEADIVVYDNCSDDKTADIAKSAGARVIRVNRKGKGYVIREILETSEADIVVLVDGDDTYEVQDVHLLIQPLVAGAAEMTVGTRLHLNPGKFRTMHHFGNRIISCLLNALFHTHFTDVLTGYRAFTRKFIEKVPLISQGFEIETEIALQALENGITVKEVPIHFRNRPPGSFSKLSSVKDGYLIILTIICMFRDHRPFFMFALMSVFMAGIGLAAWIIGFLNFGRNVVFSIVRKTGVLLIELSVGLFLVGLMLNTVNVRMRELSSLLKRKRR